MITATTLIDLINQANPTSPQLDYDDVSFSNIAPVEGVGYNTKVTVSANQGSGYFGVVDVFYHRIALVDLGSDLFFLSDVPLTPEGFVSIINQKRASELDMMDLASLVIPPFTLGEIETIQLSAQTNSLGWVGNSEVTLVQGLCDDIDLLHTLVNVTLPSNGYLS